MEKPKLIPATEVAEKLAAGVVALASAKTPEAHAAAVESMTAMFEASEIALVEHLLAPRLRCAKCNLGQSRSRASGSLCSMCAEAIKARLDVYPDM